MADEVEAGVACIAAVGLLVQEMEPEPIFKARSPGTVNSLAAAKGANAGLLFGCGVIHGSILRWEGYILAHLGREGKLETRRGEGKGETRN